MNDIDRYCDNLRADKENWWDYSEFKASCEKETINFYICFSTSEIINNEVYYIKDNDHLSVDVRVLNISEMFQRKLKIVEILNQNEYYLQDLKLGANTTQNGILLEKIGNGVKTPSELIEQKTLLNYTNRWTKEVVKAKALTLLDLAVTLGQCINKDYLDVLDQIECLQLVDDSTISGLYELNAMSSDNEIYNAIRVVLDSEMKKILKTVEWEA